ncbi:MAG: Nramp family divalent metal transporter [Candidatus Altiarchaeota archaeon]
MEPSKSVSWRRHLVLIIGIIGPGIITASVDNDAGGITTYSVAGARFGYGMLWSLIPITVLLILVQEMCSRMGVVTGKGLADLIREHFGIKVTIFIMFCLLVSNLFVTVAEFAGIAAAGGLFHIDKYVLVPLCAAFVLVATVKLNYKMLEKFFLLLAFFYLAYILSGFMSKPDWGVVGREFIMPSASITTAYMVVLVGVIGTTITPWMQFYLQSSIVEKGIRISDYKYSKWDVILGCIVTDIVSFFIIVACATVLYGNGIQIGAAEDAALALAPAAGEYAFLLFAFGLFSAALFGAFILPISTAFYVCEALGWESGVNKRFREAREFYIMLILITVIGAAVVLIPDIPLIDLMLVSQVINGVTLPVVLLALIRLVNNRKLMGEHVNGGLTNAVAWAGIALLIMTDLLMLATVVFPSYFA